MKRLLLVVAVLAVGGCNNGRINPCVTLQGTCDVNAACTKTGLGAAACICKDGYSGDGIHCAAIDSCQTNNGGCDVNATCTSSGPGTNTCACNASYSGDGVTCFVGENSCLTANGGCDANATCSTTGPGTNTCACNEGYSGDGTSCLETNSCLTNNGGCDANATCTSTGPATNACACNPGYSGDGASCAVVDSCLTSNGGCDANATCTSTGPGTNTCACNEGYSGDGVTCAGTAHTLVISFAGSGSVSVSPSGATCDTSPCSYELAEGTTVTLTATPATGWTFGIWSGCDSVDEQTCTVTMTGDRTIATGFNFDTFTLAASYEGNGSITSNPAGLDCGDICSASFATGSTVRLIAVPASSAYYVSSWTGCTSFSGATCDVTMDSNMSVKAVFSPSPTGWVDACEQAGGTSYFSDGWHDDEYTQVDIGFEYSFYGQTYTQAFVSTNALITFDSGQWEYRNAPLVAGDRMMAVLWDDLVTQDPAIVPGSSICVATIGDPGTRRMVVTFNKMGFFGSEDNTALTFSAILHEGTNAIDYVYYDMSSPQGTRGLGSDATIGIQGPTGYNQFSYNQDAIQNGSIIHFDAP